MCLSYVYDVRVYMLYKLIPRGVKPSICARTCLNCSARQQNFQDRRALISKLFDFGSSLWIQDFNLELSAYATENLNKVPNLRSTMCYLFSPILEIAFIVLSSTTSQILPTCGIVLSLPSYFNMSYTYFWYVFSYFIISFLPHGSHFLLY